MTHTTARNETCAGVQVFRITCVCAPNATVLLSYLLPSHVGVRTWSACWSRAAQSLEVTVTQCYWAVGIGIGLLNHERKNHEARDCWADHAARM